MGSPQQAQLSQNDAQTLLALYQAGDLTGVAERAKTLLQRFPHDSFLHNIRAVAFLNLGKHEEAAAGFRKVIAASPGYAEAHLNLGVALGRLGKTDEAIGSYNSAVRLKADYAEAYLNLGYALALLGRLDEALAACQRAATLRPDLAIAHNYLGGVFRELGRTKEGVESHRRALALAPRNAEYHTDLGSLFHDMGLAGEAAACFHEALRLDPNFAVAHYLLGEVLESQGDYREAAAHYRNARTPEARAKLLGCLARGGEREEYANALADLAQTDPKNIRAACVSAAITHELGLSNSYPFCTDPLSCISVYNIAEHIGPVAAFDNALVAEIRGAHFVFEPPRKTTRGGHQTSGNLFELGGRHIATLEKIFRDRIAAYVEQHRGRADTFIAQWPKSYRLKGWYVRLQRGGHQRPHIHPEGWLSGVLYLRVPAGLKGDEGAIRFTVHGDNTLSRKEGVPDLVHRPTEGDLVLFPSSLLHHTIPYDADEERHTLSFDLEPIR